MMKRAILFLTLAVLLVLAGRALAMESTHYRLDWFTLMTGTGGTAGSANYTVSFTTGQSVTGNASSPGHEACLGYWCGVATEYRIYLPLVLRNSPSN